MQHTETKARPRKTDREVVEDCALRIAEYWARRGVAVKLEIVSESQDKHKKPVYGIRSNLVNGRPVPA